MSSSSAYYKLTDGLLVQNDAQIWLKKWMFTHRLPMIKFEMLRWPSWSWSPTTCAISSYQHYMCNYNHAHGEVYSCTLSLDMTLFDKVCQWHVTGRWFTPGTGWNPKNTCRIIIWLLFFIFFLINERCSPVICEGRNVPHMRKTLAWPLLCSFKKGEV